MSNTQKLTDEQREELRKDIDDFMLSTVFNFNERNRIRRARNIIERLQSSEQAWKEEAERLQEKLKGVGVEEYYSLKYEYQQLKREIESHAPEGRNYTNVQYVSMREKYNQAIEVLSDLDAYLDFSEENPSGESTTMFIDASGVNLAYQRARDFLSSLQEDKP